MTKTHDFEAALSDFKSCITGTRLETRDAIVAALRFAAKVQAGEVKVVPVEPVREMWAAAANALIPLRDRINIAPDFITEPVYKAMLEAAPDYDWSE